jgi:hypothetical protein
MTDVSTRCCSEPTCRRSEPLRLYRAHAWLTAVTEAAGGRQQILDALGITITKKDA